MSRAPCILLLVCALAAAQGPSNAGPQAIRPAPVPSSAGPQAIRPAPIPQGRVVAIGVDGLDYEVCREMIAADDLPNLKQLSADGSFVPLEPTNPAQSPVSWATLTTGLNPGRTGINDFLRREFREDGGVSAELSLSKIETRRPFGCGARQLEFAVLGFAGILAFLGVVAWFRGSRWGAITFLVIATVVAVVWLAEPVSRLFGPRFDPHFEPRVPVNARGGQSFSERLDAAGIPTMSVLAPVAFPAPQLKHGHLISGLGVPDAMGTPGTYTSYRQEPVPAERAITQTGCRVTSIRDEGGGALAKISVPGPRPGGAAARLELPVGARVDRAAKTVRFDVAGQSCVVGERQWSPFLAGKFDLPWFQDLSVLTRFRVIEAGERVVIHQEPTCFDPRRQHPMLAITSPVEYGDDVCADGPFDTCGWGCATNPMQDEVIDEETFLSDIAEIEAQRQSLLARTLRMPDWRLFFCVLSTPDRVQHMFWRDRDPAHPRHDPGAVARRGDPIRDSYRRIDTLIGRLRKEVLKPEDLLLVVSDHGFAPWRWSVNLNRFLAEEGFLTGSGDRTERTLETSLGGPSLFRGIDWSRTRAYSMGLGKIYVNLQGEPGGIVPKSERRALLEDLRARLLALKHEGRPVVRSAALREDLYRGDRVDESADLVIGFERGYRVSWQCTLGSLDEPVISPNQNLWSGDHCSVDPSLVPGVLFSSRPLAQDRAGVADVCPTIETELGVQPAPGSDGRPLRFR